MKIAVATEGGMVFGHFGKCEQFTIFETDEKNILAKELLDTKAHSHGMLPPYLAAAGVQLVIAGGMGDGAKQKLAAQGIQYIIGVQGPIEEAVRGYLEGTLEAVEDGCHDHHHEGHQCQCHG